MSLVGTAGYRAPEVTKGEPHTAASDMFAVAVILFEALFGPEFASSALVTEADRQRKIARLNGMVEPAVANLLHSNPQKRLTAAQLLRRPLFSAAIMRKCNGCHDDAPLHKGVECNSIVEGKRLAHFWCNECFGEQVRFQSSTNLDNIGELKQREAKVHCAACTQRCSTPRGSFLACLFLMPKLLARYLLMCYKPIWTVIWNSLASTRLRK